MFVNWLSRAWDTFLGRTPTPQHRGPILVVDWQNAQPGDLLVRAHHYDEAVPPGWIFRGGAGGWGVIWKFCEPGDAAWALADVVYRGVRSID